MKIGVLPGGGVTTIPPGRLSYSQDTKAAETNCRSRIIKKIRTEESRNEGLVRSANRHPHTDRRELGGVRLTERPALNVYFSTRKL
jgi:hypothetical protein